METLSKSTLMPFVALIRAYKLLISPLLGCQCRYSPSCADYSIDSLEKHGLLKGIVLSTKRIIRCRPYGGHGLDPVPEKAEHNS